MSRPCLDDEASATYIYAGVLARCNSDLSPYDMSASSVPIEQVVCSGMERRRDGGGTHSDLLYINLLFPNPQLDRETDFFFAKLECFLSCIITVRILHALSVNIPQPTSFKKKLPVVRNSSTYGGLT